ncbi:uro-adherence factor A-like isoform X1 [Prorops nasuta]|uniref:uro-adherence factor A-like isoform X1 n=2 Tax=Prorops nasuta TaxID=863751 RepID=UPI0034CF4A96
MSFIRYSLNSRRSCVVFCLQISAVSHALLFFSVFTVLTRIIKSCGSFFLYNLLHRKTIHSVWNYSFCVGATLLNSQCYFAVLLEYLTQVIKHLCHEYIRLDLRSRSSFKIFGARIHEARLKCRFPFKKSSGMSSGGGAGPGGGGGALSLMGCVREASPPPQTQYHHHHRHHHHPSGNVDVARQNSMDPLPKEPKKRRFHPLRGLRKIFRRKSRGAADARINSASVDRDSDPSRAHREDITMRNPAGRNEEARSRSASELLTDSCDKDSVYLGRRDTEDSLVKLRGGAGKLSVSHDSVFPGEVPTTRPLSFLNSLLSLERRQARKSSEIENRDYSQNVVQKQGLSHRVLDQIKTVIENRNQLASATATDASGQHAFAEHYQQETTEDRFASLEKHERITEEIQHRVVSKSTKDHAHRVSGSKEELPELETKTLNHTAAHHRISVRPRNRRPPRRAAPATTITTINEDNLDSLENVGAPMAASSAASSPTEPKKVSRKSSSRLSRNSEIFDELESKLPRKPSSVASLSPDSLDATIASRSSVETSEEQIEIRPVARKLSNRISKGSDVFEELESKLPRRRSSNRLSKSPDSLESPGSWFSKSTEGFDKLVEHEESRPTYRRSLNPISKSTDRVSKSSDSLEVLETLASDDSIERRRSSFESRARKASKLMSKSTESFETMEQQAQVHHDNRGIITDVNFTGQEPLNRGSITDISIRTRRLSTSGSKSSDSFEIVDVNECCKDAEDEDEASSCPRRSSKRMSSESSDNLDLDDRLENRRVRRLPKRVPSTSIVDIVPVDDPDEEKRPTPLRKPSRLQKSSESSELGSTDTLDSDRKNKSTGSTETLDSLERDLEQDRKDEDITENILDRREKNDSWVKNTSSESNRTSMTERTEDSKVSSDKSYWRQSSESKENLDIHQLLAITTIVTRMNDNGNNQRSPVIYARKKQQISASPPTSPVAKQDDNNLVFDNLLTTKNDEDLQNMLNGNISSEVSSTTDTKSFKEKLIMFEKLGK